MKAKSVLVVDENEEFVASVLSYLNTNFMVPIISLSSNCKDAMRKGEIINPDLILMDLTTEDSLNAIKQLKELPSSPRIIMTSFFDNKDYRSIAREAGADAFLNKKMFGNEITSMVKILFSGINNCMEYLETSKN
jgi:two-component system, NarL family, response regulator DevR